MRDRFASSFHVGNRGLDQRKEDDALRCEQSVAADKHRRSPASRLPWRLPLNADVGLKGERLESLTCGEGWLTQTATNGWHSQVLGG